MSRTLPLWSLTLVAALGCRARTVPPPAEQDLRALAVRAAESALSGAAGEELEHDVARAIAFDRDRPQKSGLGAALSLLAAECRADRDRRVEDLERLADETGDALARKQAFWLLERDEAWLARRLGHDAVYSRFAGFWNGLLEMAFGALQGNPFGVVRPVVAGVEGLIEREALDPRDRKSAALLRDWLRKNGDVEALPDDLEDIRDRVEDLREAMLEEERRLFDRLLSEGQAEAALAHLGVMERLSRDRAEIERRARVVEGELDARRKRLEASLKVSAPPVEVARTAEDLLADTAADRRTLEAADDPAQVRIVEARAAVREARLKYILTGRLQNLDPLLRRREVRRDMHRSIQRAIAWLLWPPLTLVRAVHVAVADPVDDRPVVDALAYAASERPLASERGGWLSELAERYEDRGEFGKALAVARASGADPKRIEKLERRIAETEPPKREGRVAASIPLRGLGPIARDLGLVDLAVDPPRIEITERGIRYRIAGWAAAVEQRVDSELLKRLRGLADEWNWRRRALGNVTHAEASEGVPVSLEAGVGASGIRVTPRLLPEAYVARDRRYYE